jgi:ABC-2 type transport system ATP-binding protein
VVAYRVDCIAEDQVLETAVSVSPHDHQVRADFAGVITRTDQPVRAEWAWRRGRARHEYWPDADPSNPPAGATAVAPDLEDIVIALSLARRDAVRS